MQSTNKGSETSAGEQFPPSEKQDPNQNGQEMRTTGPRTPLGKQRSKRNATKYAIYSNAVLIEGESRSVLNSLSRGFREYYQPRGAPEEIKVDELVALHWRLLRVLIAEKEIGGMRFPRMQEDHQSENQVIFRVVFDGQEETNLMQAIADPKVLEECLGLLKDLKLGIESRGFDTNRDSYILTRLYGERTNMSEGKTLFDSYRVLLSMANCTEEERQKNGFASPQQCKKDFLEALDEEVRRLERYRSSASERALPRYPDSWPDYLLRREAHLERLIDRKESELERMQRRRLGQPVLPELKVRHSLS